MLSELKQVYTVYQEKSFSKAAKKLHLSQPALSANIKKIENQLGCIIFDRSTIPLSITDEGQYCLGCIKDMLSIENKMETYFIDKQNPMEGKLTLGGSSYFCGYVYPYLINLFHQKYPKVKIELIEDNTAGLISGLSDEHIDIIFETCINPSNKEIQTYIYDTEHILLAVPIDWKINQKLLKYQIPEKAIQNCSYLSIEFPEVPLIEFKNLPFINLKEGNDQWYRGQAICKNVGFTPLTNFKLDQILTALIIASNTGRGALFIRDSLIRALRSLKPKLVYYKIGDPLATRDVLIGVKKSRYITEIMKEFIRLACPSCDI